MDKLENESSRAGTASRLEMTLNVKGVRYYQSIVPFYSSTRSTVNTGTGFEIFDLTISSDNASNASKAST